MTGSSRHRASHTPPTIQSLPIEILSQVISFIDKSTALSLARVSRHFTPHCDAAIWYELHLMLSDYWGQCPTIPPYTREGNWAAYDAWEGEEAERVAASHSRGLRDKMKVILFRLDERRAGLVKRVKIIPLTCSADRQLQILDLVQDGLEVLDILPTTNPILQFTQDPLSHMTLDFKLLHIDICFPNLTSVTIGESALHYMGFLVLICRLAPNLASLDVERTLGKVEDDAVEPSFPALERDTKLKALRITTSDYIGLRAGEVEHILNLLQRSPQIRDLSLDFDEYSASEHTEFLQIVSAHTNLRNLHFIETLPSLNVAHGDAVIGGSVRSLVLRSYRWWNVFLPLPNAPNVEAIFLFPYQTTTTPRQPSFPLPEPAAPQAMVPRFAERLRSCSALRIIHTASEPIGETESRDFTS